MSPRATIATIGEKSIGAERQRQQAPPEAQVRLADVGQEPLDPAQASTAAGPTT